MSAKPTIPEVITIAIILSIITIIVLFQPTPAPAHNTGRWCQNPYCMMCNRLHLQHGHGQSTGNLTYQSYQSIHTQLHQRNTQRTTQQRPISAPPRAQTTNPNYQPFTNLPPAPTLQATTQQATQHLDPTPHEVVEAMLKHTTITEDDVLYDLGCGDGRILIHASKTYGCRTAGIEINPTTAQLAKDNIKKAKLHHLARVTTGDATAYKLDKATIATMYLYPDLMEKIVPLLTNTHTIISYSHPIPGKPKQQKILHDGKYPIYIWTTKPKPLTRTFPPPAPPKPKPTTPSYSIY